MYMVKGFSWLKIDVFKVLVRGVDNGHENNQSTYS